MKKIFALTVALSVAVQLSAQSTNPLDYSGKLYVTSYDILSTTRYVSFEDHGILSSDMTYPVRDFSTIIFDFENNLLTNEAGTTHRINVLQTKKYDMTDGTWNVVVYIDFLDDDNQYELVWREYDNPYFMAISRKNGRLSIVCINLSTVAASL